MTFPKLSSLTSLLISYASASMDPTNIRSGLRETVASARSNGSLVHIADFGRVKMLRICSNVRFGEAALQRRELA